METFTAVRALVENPHYPTQRRHILRELRDEMIDRPIIDLVKAFNRLPYCFTLQCCYGHFVYNGQTDPDNLAPLPAAGIDGPVEYRIAYLALCFENSLSGRALLESLGEITAIDPDYVQFGCAQWFWGRQINSYALQVEPERFKHQDTAMVDFREALRLEKIRAEFFTRLRALLEKEKSKRRRLK